MRSRWPILTGSSGLPGLRFWGTLAVVLLLGPSVFGQQFQEVEKRKLRHILLRSEKQADEVIQEFRGGAKFSSLARKRSFDVVTKRLGGQLGWTSRGTYDPAFDQAAFGIPKVGEVAKCKSQFGWHVILLEDRSVERIPVRPDARPKPPVPPRPVQSQANSDISVKLEFDKTAHAPGEDIFFTLTLKNDTLDRDDTEPKSLKVFDPSLWPMGLTVRYEKGKLNSKLDFSSVEEPSNGYLFDLEPGESRTQRYRMQDYAGDMEIWPIVRVNWRGNIFMGKLATQFPAFAEEDHFELLRKRWRYYSCLEAHVNVLPDYSPSDKWYALFYVSGGTLWVELEDSGVDGVVSYWIDQVRNEVYDKVEFTDFKEGTYATSGIGLNRTFRLVSQGWRSKAAPLERGTLALAVASGTQGTYVGTGLHVCFGDAPELAMKALPIGRVVVGERTMDRLSAAFAKGTRARARITRVDVYPESILPQRVRESIAREKALPGSHGNDAPKSPETRPTTQARTAAPKFAADLPTVEVTTERGSFVIQLAEDHAPNTVAHFVELVERGYYNGKKFDRLQRDQQTGFIQGGSPGKGQELGYFVPDEISSLRHQRGSVGLARKRSTPNTGGERFYICYGPIPDLDGQWTVFGRVLSGMKVVEYLNEGSVMKNVRMLSKRPHDYRAKRLPKNSR